MAKKDNIIQFPIRKKSDPNNSESVELLAEKPKKTTSKKSSKNSESKPAKASGTKSKIAENSESTSKKVSKKPSKNDSSITSKKAKVEKATKPANTQKTKKSKPKAPQFDDDKKEPAVNKSAGSKGKLIHVDFMNHNKTIHERTKTLDQIDSLDWRKLIAEIPGNEIISYINSVGPCRFVISDSNRLPDNANLVWLYCPVCGTRQYSSLLSNGAGRRHNKCGSQIEEKEIEISLKGESAVCVLNVLRSIYIGKKINHFMEILTNSMEGKELPPDILEEFKLLNWIGINQEPCRANFQDLIVQFREVFNFAEMVIDSSISFLKTLIELQGNKITTYSIHDFGLLVKENSFGLERFRLISKFFSEER